MDSETRGMTPNYAFTVPRSFDPLEFLPVRLWPHADDARWLLSTIITKTAYRDVDPWNFVRLHSDIIRRVMNQRTQPEIVRALDRGGVIETAGYWAGVKSTGYRLTARYLGDRCDRRPITDPALLARLQREQDRLGEQQRPEWTTIHQALNREQYAITITKAVDKLLESLPEHTRLCQSVLVDRIQRREFPFSVSSTGRVFNGVTGMKRELRAELRLGGEPLGSVDIKCTQPALLAHLLTRPHPATGYKNASTYIYETAFPGPPLCSPDSARFASLACSGSLYDVLVSRSGFDRSDVKVALLRDVLAKRGGYPSDFEDIFRADFPSVHSAVRRINQGNHASLIRLLQRAESDLVIGHVAPKLLGHAPVVTLHDAIYSTVPCLPAVENAFTETFDALGCRLALTTERPGGAAAGARYRSTLDQSTAPCLCQPGEVLAAQNPAIGQWQP